MRVALWALAILAALWASYPLIVGLAIFVQLVAGGQP